MARTIGIGVIGMGWMGTVHSRSYRNLADRFHSAGLRARMIVCADDAAARERVIGLANLIDGVRGVDGGGLQNARYVEDFTAMLLNINRIYGAHSTIKIVGI